MKYNYNYTSVENASTFVKFVETQIGVDGTWSETTQQYVLKVGRAKVVLQFPSNVSESGTIKVKGAGSIIGNLEAQVIEEFSELTQEHIDSSIVKGTTIAKVKRRLGIILLRDFRKFIDGVESAGFKNVILDTRVDTTYNKELTLVMANDFGAVNYDNYYVDNNEPYGYSNNTIYHLSKNGANSQVNKLVWIESDNGDSIACWVSERNWVFVPISTNLSRLDKFLETIAYIGSRVEEQDLSDFAVNQAIKNMQAGIINKITSTETSITNARNNIQNYEREIGKHIEDITLNSEELIHLQQRKKVSKDTLMLNIEACKKVKFVDDCQLTDKGVSITFKPTYCKKSINSKMLYGYLGKITISYTNGSFSVTSDLKEKYDAYVHPHVNVNSPCMGGGTTAATQMLELASKFELADLSYILIMWIKSWRTGDCYHQPGDMMSDRLIRGLPVFNAAGVRLNKDSPEIKGIVTAEDTSIDKKDIAKAEKEFKTLKLEK